MKKEIFYHGSMTSGLKVLIPKRDTRLGIEGVFLSNEPFGPMIFSLLPDRSKAHVEYHSRQGEFQRGRIIAPFDLQEEGWLYTVELSPHDITLISHGEGYAGKPIKIMSSQKIMREQVIAMGWAVESAHHDLPSFRVVKI